jgi:hypothetical protein
MLNIKTFFLVASLSIVFSYLNAQPDTSKPFKTKNIIWFTPCGTNKIKGVAVGLQAMNINGERLIINGLNADIGLGGFIATPYAIFFALSSKKKQSPGFIEADSAETYINGLSISMGGEFNVNLNGINIAGGVTGAYSINGISVTGIFTKTKKFRGICISGLHNIALNGRGIQIGLFNNCKDLKGLQLGLWNKSGKRGLPLINWGI